jgi:hypothetical protein
MAGERTFIVRFLADTANAIKGIKGVTGELGGLNKSTGGIFESFNAISIAATAAFAGLGAMASKAVSAAIEDAKEQELLAQTLRNVTGATDDVIKKNEDMIAGFARTTTFSDSMLRPALAALVQGSGSLATAQKDITLAMDIATATQTPLIDVASALAKGYNDQFKALKALSPSLNDNIKAGQSLDQVFAELNDRFGGAAAAAAGTTAGQMAILKNQMSELSESIGSALVPILETLLPLFQAVADFAMQHNTLFKFLVITVSGLAAAYLAYNLALKAEPLYLAAVTAAQWLLNYAMDANPIGVFILAVAGLSAAFLYLTNNMQPLINAWNHLANGFGRLLNLIPGVNIALIDTSNSVGAVNANLYPMPSTLEQTAQGWHDVAGACVEFMKVSPEKILFDASYRLQKMAHDLYGAETSYKISWGGFEKSAGGAAKSVKLATDKLKEYTDALKSTNSAQKAFIQAQKTSTKANESLTAANKNVADAEAALAEARAGYGADSVQAKRAAKELEIAQRGLERAGYNVEGSLFAVADAEAALKKVRADPESTPQAIREAEIALAEAKLSSADAIDAQTEATDGLTKANGLLSDAIFGVSTGSDIYKTLSDQLTTAKQNQADATDAVRDAIERETDALNNYAAAIEAAGKIAQKYPGVAGSYNMANPMSGAAGAIPKTVTGNISFGGRGEQGGNGFNVVVQAGIVSSPDQIAQELADLSTRYAKLNGGRSVFGTGI